MSNPTIANVLIVNWVFISVIVAGQGNVPLRSCYVNTSDTHLWRNCKISLYGSNGRATCDCVGCRDHRTIITCNDRGEWNLAELEDTTKSCSMCQNDVTCAYNGKCNQTSHNRRCYCNRNCQEIISACNNFGEWEHAVHLCFETSGTMTITIGSDWKSVNWRSTSTGLELLCTNDYTTVNRGSAMCSDGKLSNVIPPTCKISPCGATPSTLNCNVSKTISNSARCTCNDNCLSVDLQCRNGSWEFDRNNCSATYVKYPFQRNVGKAYITALKLRDTERFDFEVHCPEGEIVVHAGRVSCDYGVLNVISPKCDEYEKQTFHLPNIGEYEIAASKKSGNNFEHIVYCSKKYVTISNGSAVCINAEFNITQHPRCEPPCEGFPSNVNCSETSSGNFNATRHCTCSHNATINTTLRCSGGKWNLETECPDMMVSDQTQLSWTTPVAATIAILLILLVTALVMFVYKRKKKREVNSMQVIFHPNSEEIEVENELYYPAEGITGVRESILQGYSTIDEMKQFVKSAAVSTSETENGDTLYTLPPK